MDVCGECGKSVDLTQSHITYLDGRIEHLHNTDKHYLEEAMLDLVDDLVLPDSLNIPTLIQSVLAQLETIEPPLLVHLSYRTIVNELKIHDWKNRFVHKIYCMLNRHVGYQIHEPYIPRYGPPAYGGDPWRLTLYDFLKRKCKATLRRIPPQNECILQINNNQ